MTDPAELENQPLTEPIKPKPKGWPKGKSRKKPTPAQAKPVEVPDEFAGLSETSCCNACRKDWCVISHTWMPAHTVPARQNHFGQMMPAEDLPDQTICGRPNVTPINVFVKDFRVVDRYQRAKKILEHQILDSRNKGITRGR